MINNKTFRFYKISSFIFLAGASLALASCGGTSSSSTSLIPVTAVSMTATGDATTITVDGGTLQMLVLVEPENASDKSVLWTISDGSGEATISASGLVTAMTDGSATVRVTSVDVTSIFDTFNLTFSNQTSISKAALVNAIAEARVTQGTAISSADGSDVLTNAQWVSTIEHTAYSASIDAAQTVADIAVVSQIQVDDAISALALATVAFNNAKENGTQALVSHAIDLGTSENYVLLAQSAISTTGVSMITGDVAVSPAAGTYLTGFSETKDAGNTFATSDYVVGHLFAFDYADPTPVVLTTATGDMATAYNQGTGILPDYNELYAGDLSGKTLYAGSYNWTNNMLINADLTLSGSDTDIWVFQIAGTLTQAAGVRITLAGGAQPKNIFWLVADSVSIEVGAHSEGVILGSANIAMKTNSSINGRLLAQTAITLDACTVVQPS